jgi:ferredoxin
MTTRSTSLVVDPTRCDGHGVCAELFPERITTDPWGFPIIDATPMSESELWLARRAVVSCPKLALHLVEHRP